MSGIVVITGALAELMLRSSTLTDTIFNIYTYIYIYLYIYFIYRAGFHIGEDDGQP